MHDRPPARRTRLPLMPHQQVFDYPVELRMLTEAEPQILLEPNIPRSPDSSRFRHCRKSLAHQPAKLFTRKLFKQILFSHGARFYLLQQPVQQYFRTTRPVKASVIVFLKSELCMPRSLRNPRHSRLDRKIRRRRHRHSIPSPPLRAIERRVRRLQE
jgi:hypothetical protein